MSTRKIIWDRQALNYFQDAISYIRKDSTQNAESVKNEILERIEALSHRPEIYPLDKHKIDNPGNYRAFEIYRLRIAR